MKNVTPLGRQDTSLAYHLGIPAIGRCELSGRHEPDRGPLSPSEAACRSARAAFRAGIVCHLEASSIQDTRTRESAYLLLLSGSA